MRMTVVLWVGLLLAVTTTVSAQAVYRLKIERSAPLEQVLQDLKLRYALDFAYAVQDLEGVTIGPLELQTERLEELLSRLLRLSGLDYSMQGRGEVLLRRQKEPAAAPIIEGQIVDASSGSPVAGVAVVLLHSQRGTYTDEAGRFRLPAPLLPADSLLQFRHIAYDPLILSRQKLSQQPRISLKTTAYEAAEVTVVERLPTLLDLRRHTLTSTHHGSAVDALGRSALLPDLLRSLQLLPGLTAHDDRSSALRIRGSEGDETLVILDGIPLYRAEHLYGIFSAINPDFVSSWELYKTASPIAYGGRTGGTLLLQSAAALNQWQGTADLNLLTAGGSLGMPLGKGGHLLLAGRSALGNAADSKIFEWAAPSAPAAGPAISPNLSRPALQATMPVFRFADFNARLQLPISPRWQVGLSAIHSRDDFDNAYSQTFPSRQRREQVRNTEKFSQLEDWNSTAYGAQLKYHFSTHSQLHFEAYRTFHRATADIRAGIERTTPKNSRAFYLHNRWENVQQEQALRLYLSRGRNGAFSLRTLGLEAIAYRNDYLFQEDEATVLNGANTPNAYTAFAEWEGRAGSWQFRPGLRLMAYTGTDRLYASPRVRLTNQLSDNWLAKAAYSIESQFVRTINLEDRLGQSLNVLAMGGTAFPVGRADHYILGGEGQAGPWTFDMEAYYKRLYQQVAYALLRPGIAGSETRKTSRGDYQTYTGSGRVVGLDLLVGYRQGLYRGQLAYTLSRATHQFSEIFRGQPFPMQADRRHQLKSISELEWKQWEFTLTALYVSGRPYTDLSLIEQQSDRRQLSPEVLIRRLPAYQRFDLGVAYRLTWSGTQLRFYASVFNLFNRFNVDYRQYIFALPVDRPNVEDHLINTVVGAQTNLLDRTVNMGMRLSF